MPTEKQTIYSKLLEFHKNNIKVTKGGTNPAFRSKYATLNNVLEAIKEPLTDVGIVILQTPQETGLRTQLISAEDGSYIESFLPYVDVSTPQKLGSNNTYNRRYALVTMLSLEDEDDDGNHASNITTTARQTFDSPAPRPHQQTLTPETYEKRDAEKLEDGPATIVVASIKKGMSATTGKPWEAVSTTDGHRVFNNSGEALHEGVTYDVTIERGGIKEILPSLPF